MTVLPPSAGVIGWPVAHSKSPLIHRFWLAKLGIDGEYGRFPVHPDNLGAAIPALPKLGLRGVNVTVPHKVAVMPHLDRIDDTATRIGAVNTVVVDNGDIIGFNTDAVGFFAPLQGAMDDFPADRIATLITLIGTGGAARAVASALGGMEVTVYGRDPGKAAELADSFGLGGGSAYGSSGDLADLANATWYDKIAGTPLDDKVDQRYNKVIVNATSLGMTGQPALAIDLRPYPDDTVVYDLVYAPLETPLLAAARARGMRTIDGLQMLVGQAAVAFELFFSHPAPRDHDAELRRLLTA